MNRITTTLISLLFILPVVNGQISDELKRAAIDTLNYGIVNYITSDVTHNDFEKNYKINDSIKDKGVRIFKSITGNVSNGLEAQKISPEINKLKNKGFILRDADQLAAYLTFDIFTDGQNKYFYDFYTSRCDSTGTPSKVLKINLDKISSNIKYLVNKYENFSLTENSNTNTTVQNSESQSTQREGNDPGIFKWLWLLPFIALLVLATIYHGRLQVLSAHIKRLKEEREVKPEAPRSYREENYDAALKTIKEKLIDFERKIEELKTQKPQVVQNAITTTTEDRKETAIPHRQPTRLFFPVPDKEGFFRSSQGLADMSSVSAYEFIINAQNSQQANFRLIETPDVIQNALNSPDSYLLPVCKMNIQPGPGKKIRKIQPGVAELNGSNWIVIEKAYIEFE